MKNHGQIRLNNMNHIVLYFHQNRIRDFPKLKNRVGPQSGALTI